MKGRDKRKKAKKKREAAKCLNDEALSGALSWLAANREIHVRQWVALSGDRLLATGSNALEVYSRARELGIAVPFVVYVDPDGHLPFLGW